MEEIHNWITNFLNVIVIASTRRIQYLSTKYIYDKGLYVGQRYFDKNNKEYDYAFDFRLSYTECTFSDLSLDMSSEGLIVKFKVKNCGIYDGKVFAIVFLNFVLIIILINILKVLIKN